MVTAGFGLLRRMGAPEDDLGIVRGQADLVNKQMDQPSKWAGALFIGE